MPTVPILNSGVQSQGLSGGGLTTGGASIDAFGGNSQATTTAAKGLGELATHYVDQQKKRFDQVNIQDYDTALSKIQTDLETQASQMRGRDAAGAQGLIETGWKAGLDSLGSMLNNDEQRAAAKTLAGNRYESLYKNVAGHTARELTNYDLESTNSTIANARDEAVRNYKDPNAVAAAIQKQHDTLSLFAETYKKGDEPWFQENLRANVSKTHSEIISRMLDNNQDLLAQSTFSHVKEQLSGEDAAKLEKALKVGSIKGETQRVTDSIMGQGLDYAASREKVKETVKDPEVRAEALKSIETEFAAKDKAATYQKAAVVHDLTKQIALNKGQIDLPSNVLAELPIETQDGLKKFRNGFLAGDDVPPHSAKYFYLKSLANNKEKREEFANRDIPSETLNEVSSKERDELTDLWFKVREKDGVTTELLNYQGSNDKIIEDTMNSIGKAGWFSSDGLSDQEGLNFRSSIAEEMKQQEKVLNRKLNATETKEIVNRLATKVVTQSSWFRQLSKPVGSLRPEDISVESISPEHLSVVKQSLKNRGMLASDANITKLYVEALKAGKMKPSGE